MTLLVASAATDLAALAARIPGLRGDLRSDHAGETGAVMIYRGILAGTRDAAVRRFATAHLATEQRHLALLDGLLPPAGRSVLLPLWRIAGWLTGFLPARAGTRAVYATIDAVETFVDRHYEEQIIQLPAGDLRDLLMTCQADEVRHRDEARELYRDEAHGMAAGRPGVMLRAWVWLVGFGSRTAVAAARRI